MMLRRRSGVSATSSAQTKASRCFETNASTVSGGRPPLFSTKSLVPAKTPFVCRRHDFLWGEQGDPIVAPLHQSQQGLKRTGREVDRGGERRHLRGIAAGQAIPLRQGGLNTR